MYIAYTDAGVKSNKTYHSYCLFDKDNKLVKGEVVSSDIIHSDKAEEYSLKLLLDYVEEHELDNVKVHTDCSSMVDRFKNRIQELRIKSLNVTIEWVRREFNKLTDLACSYGDSKFYKENEIVELWSKIMNFEKPNTLTKNCINHKMDEKMKKYTINLYKKITNDNSVSIDDILNWSIGRLTVNSKKGIRYLIREFVEFRYMTSNFEKDMIDILNDKNKISEDYRHVKLKHEAYMDYINSTKKNKELTLKQARLKLYRNVKLSKLVYEDKRKNFKVYQYGYIKIYVSKNTITKVETCNYIPKGWSINREVYNNINSILGINY